MKEKVLEYLSELQDQVQFLRENGETDLRTVLRFINSVESKIRKLDDRLSEAESLLSDARDLLSNVHCYETTVYKEIGVFLNGEDEEEFCDFCENNLNDCSCEYCDYCNENIEQCTCECCEECKCTINDCQC